VKPRLTMGLWTAGWDQGHSKPKPIGRTPKREKHDAFRGEKALLGAVFRQGLPVRGREMLNIHELKGCL